MLDWCPLSKNLLKKMPSALKPWLTKPYALSAHLQSLDLSWRLQFLGSGKSALTSDEQQRMGCGGLAGWRREICHQVDGKPLVYATVSMPSSTYLAHQKQLDQLGDAPIGKTLLFTNRAVKREKLMYLEVSRQDKDFAEAFLQLAPKGDVLWARSSVFSWQGEPLLITEFFLPEMPEFKPIMPLTLRGKLLVDAIMDFGYLARLNRPLPMLLLIWPTLWGLWLAARGFPGWHLLLVFVIGAILMRSAGCVFNDIADRRFDGFVERTKLRPLATGRMSVKVAWGFGLSLAFIAFLLVLTLNWLTVGLSVVGLLLSLLYPLMKRVIHAPQLVLGLAFNWGIIMAFAAVMHAVPLLAWYVWGVAIIWTVAYDTMYALADREDDLKLGLKSTAIWFGRYDRLAIALLEGLMLLLLSALGGWYQFTAWYYAGLVVVLGLFLYQHRWLKTYQPRQCIWAFSHNHFVGCVIFLAFASQYRW